MEHKWMKSNILSDEYENGVIQLLEIHCHCKLCRNTKKCGKERNIKFVKIIRHRTSSTQLWHNVAKSQIIIAFNIIYEHHVGVQTSSTQVKGCVYYHRQITNCVTF